MRAIIYAMVLTEEKEEKEGECVDAKIGWLIGAIICFIVGGYLIFTSL